MGSDIRETTLGVLLAFSNGHSSPERADYLPYPVYGSNGVIGRTDTANAEAGSIVIGRVGSQCGSLYFSRQPCWVTDNAIRATALNNNDPRFLFYLLSALELNGWRTGSGQPLLNQDILSHVPANVPPVPEQRAIGGILGALDDKIELNRRMNETLEAIARALFKSWFIDFDPVRAKTEGRDPGLPADIAALFPDSFEDSDLGEIPKGWRVERLSVAMTFQGGAQPPASEFISESCEGYVRLVQIRDFYSSSHITFVPDTKKLRKFTTDDIMIARYGSSGNAGESSDSLARICRGLSGAYNVALVKVVPHRPIREYLDYFLRSRAFQSVIKGMGARSVQSGFRKEDLDVISVVIAPDPVHAAFERFATNTWRRTYANREISRTLAALRDTLLPKLLSGELRVEDAERLADEGV